MYLCIPFFPTMATLVPKGGQMHVISVQYMCVQHMHTNRNIRYTNKYMYTHMHTHTHAHTHAHKPACTRTRTHQHHLSLSSAFLFIIRLPLHHPALTPSNNPTKNRTQMPRQRPMPPRRLHQQSPRRRRMTAGRQKEHLGSPCSYRISWQIIVGKSEICKSMPSNHIFKKPNW